MALSVTATQQTSFSVDADSFTTGSSSPTSGALYVVHVVGRGQASPVRTPTLSGTNGWSTTWTRVSAARVAYAFGGSEVASTETFWGVASSGTAGTLTADFGAGTDLAACAIHVSRIDGGPDTTAPIGVTGTAHDDSASQSTVTATLTGTPAATSIVLACGATDAAGSTPTAGTNYTLYGSAQTPDAGSSGLEYDEAPSSTSVTFSWNFVDILSISAVEILMASGEPPAAPSFILRVGVGRPAGSN